MAKEDRFYNCGLSRAYELVKAGGIECLEAEMRKRGAYNIPANTNSYQLKKAAREHCQTELMIVATAMADTMENDMMLPPSVLADFLKKFNDKCDRFRDNPEEWEQAKQRLDEAYALNRTIDLFNKKYENGGKENE